MGFRWQLYGQGSHRALLDQSFEGCRRIIWLVHSGPKLGRQGSHPGKVLEPDYSAWGSLRAWLYQFGARRLTYSGCLKAARISNCRG